MLAQKHGGKSYYRLLGELIYREAMKGKAPFVREILDRVEGRTQDEGRGGPPVQVVNFIITEALPPPGYNVTPVGGRVPQREIVRAQS